MNICQGDGIKKGDSATAESPFGCLGRIRTLTGGTRIRRATITPQDSVFCFCGAKLSFYFETAKQKSTFLDFLLHFFYKLIIRAPQTISNLYNFNRLASFDIQSTYYFFKTIIITEI